MQLCIHEFQERSSCLSNAVRREDLHALGLRIHSEIGILAIVVARRSLETAHLNNSGEIKVKTQRIF
jgi:hypothetical protein